MATANFNIQPEDGWTAVTDAGVDFIRIRNTDNKVPFYVTSGSTAPAATDIGYKVGCEDFWCDVATAELFYVRTVENRPEGMTISVFFLETVA